MSNPYNPQDFFDIYKTLTDNPPKISEYRETAEKLLQHSDQERLHGQTERAEFLTQTAIEYLKLAGTTTSPEVSHPPIDPDNYPYHIGRGMFRLYEWLYSGEKIAELVKDDPEMWKLEQFIDLDDLTIIIRAWCLCNGINPNDYPTLNEEPSHEPTTDQ